MGLDLAGLCSGLRFETFRRAFSQVETVLIAGSDFGGQYVA
jgi:hypothetical protein